MWARVFIASLVGGIIVFCMGAVNHTVFHLQERTFLNIPDSSDFSEYLNSRSLKHGLYVFPDMPTVADHSDPAKMAAINERYGAGPSGMLLIVHKGPIFMGENLGKEFASNVIAALMASWVVSLIAGEVGLVRRWFAVVVMGLFSWFSLAASYGIWYRFPHDFVHDEFWCALIEWGVAGLAIAAVVKRKPAAVVVSQGR
jgi:hypothetical protein